VAIIESGNSTALIHIEADNQILHELSFNINFYETSLGNVIRYRYR